MQERCDALHTWAGDPAARWRVQFENDEIEFGGRGDRAAGLEQGLEHVPAGAIARQHVERLVAEVFRVPVPIRHDDEPQDPGEATVDDGHQHDVAVGIAGAVDEIAQHLRRIDRRARVLVAHDHEQLVDGDEVLGRPRLAHADVGNRDVRCRGCAWSRGV